MNELFQLSAMPEPAKPLEAYEAPQRRVQGDHWVDDEIFVRDARKAMQEIPRTRADDVIIGGKNAGPGLQLRPYQAPGAEAAHIRVTAGRTLKRMIDLANEGKVVDLTGARVVIGACLSCGDGRRVRVEGAIHLDDSMRLDPEYLVELKMGLWKDAFFSHAGSLWFRCVLWLTWPSVAGVAPYNEPVEPGLTGRTIIVRPVPHNRTDGYPWLRVEMEKGNSAYNVEAAARIARAVQRKANRVAFNYAMFRERNWLLPVPVETRLAELRENMHWATSETLVRLALDFPTLRLPEIVANLPDQLAVAESWSQGMKTTRRRRHYGPPLVRLFELDAARLKSRGVASLLGTAAPNLETAEPTYADNEACYHDGDENDLGGES